MSISFLLCSVEFFEILSYKLAPGPFAFWAPCFPCVLGIGDVPPATTIVTKQQDIPHCTSTQTSLTPDTKPMHHSIICLKSQLFTSVLTTRMVRSLEEVSAIEKTAIQGISIKKISETVFFRVAQTWQTVTCRSNTQRTTRRQHEFDTPCDSPQTQSAPHTHTPNTPAYPKMGSPYPQKCPGPTFPFQKKKTKVGSEGHFVF